MNIKEASLLDLPEITKLFDEYRQFYKQKSDLKGAEKFIEERILKQESKIYLLMDGSTCCGFTQLYPIFTSLSMKRAWILNDLFVRLEHRKKGGGKALIEKTAELARETRAKYIQLSTAFDNRIAQKLYESIGFVKDEEFIYYTWVV
ncbi:FR47-like protein [Leptospira interrogans serovar Grippotyphosa str. UI 12769]|uniref:FR47-like protein n=2 Tax=Leptospira interrogans TaxID=173 RepID=M6GEY7_LEPIR|nr:GNAT family N-acetyltransferase [Leptospira interrogans]EMM81912.1 FR47-like protein [Leptospira interrogans str. 2006001854]AJR15888.1 acetyltransferase [Leptospira interrogans serovar Linhai str. 56609]EKR43544.1 FR47-like protein [Leptospira interrogans serovar Grippotyphosa str. UI 08368]EMN68417.1 FR47-like protein [Leptospira interrogans serovar Grippotyphosa str. UI 08434]EMN84816.1 FR47-like protein [Leptospira interrogans serovar Grippotyphosa str. UI 12769]